MLWHNTQRLARTHGAAGAIRFNGTSAVLLSTPTIPLSVVSVLNCHCDPVVQMEGETK